MKIISQFARDYKFLKQTQNIKKEDRFMKKLLSVYLSLVGFAVLLVFCLSSAVSAQVPRCSMAAGPYCICFDQVVGPSRAGFSISDPTFANSMVPGLLISTAPDIVGVAATQDGPFVYAIPLPMVIDRNGTGVIEYFVKGLALGDSQLIWVPDDPSFPDFLPGIPYFPVRWDSVGPQIQSVILEPIDSPLDLNPNVGGGQRIFPDRETPFDPKNRRKVLVKATTIPAVAGESVFFRSFDMDDPDPAMDGTDVDPNGPSGDDNREYSGFPKNGQLSSSFALTDAIGNAQVEFTVTMHPGDNFKVAASCGEQQFHGVSLNPDDGTNLIDNWGNTLPSFSAKASEMLTVWRRVHIEVDSMGVVPVGANSVAGIVLETGRMARDGTSKLTVNQILESGRFENGRIVIGSDEFEVVDNRRDIVTIKGWIANEFAAGQTFILYDDDNFNGIGGLNGDEGKDIEALPETFSHLQGPTSSSDWAGLEACGDPERNALARAYICLVYDGGGDSANNESYLPFYANVPDTTNALVDQLNLGIDSLGNESAGFWVAYVQLAYQGDTKYDNDPVGGSADGGVTLAPDMANRIRSCGDVPIGSNGSLIFLETSMDMDAADSTGVSQVLRGVVPHEVGHQFGLDGDRSGFEVMSNLVTGEPLQFVPTHLNILRCRACSPGTKPIVYGPGITECVTP
jgi:hypothetical protein